MILYQTNDILDCGEPVEKQGDPISYTVGFIIAEVVDGHFGGVRGHLKVFHEIVLELVGCELTLVADDLFVSETMQ